MPRYRALTSFNLAGQPINSGDVLPDTWPGQNAHQIEQLVADKKVARLPDELAARADTLARQAVAKHAATDK